MSEQRDPDGLERLWAPYRMAYVRSADADDGCPFCAMVAEGSQASLVVVTGERAFVAMNLYPYNPGHLMVLPKRHVGDYVDLTDAETAEVALLTQQSLAALRKVSDPPGFNVGINLGGVAGGSLSSHLHQHVVPRWSGDANFMTVISQTKALPQIIEDSAALLRDAWPSGD